MWHLVSLPQSTDTLDNAKIPLPWKGLAGNKYSYYDDRTVSEDITEGDNLSYTSAGQRNKVCHTKISHVILVAWWS